jgi:hypothetical protein
MEGIRRQSARSLQAAHGCVSCAPCEPFCREEAQRVELQHALPKVDEQRDAPLVGGRVLAHGGDGRLRRLRVPHRHQAVAARRRLPCTVCRGCGGGGSEGLGGRGVGLAVMVESKQASPPTGRRKPAVSSCRFATGWLLCWCPCWLDCRDWLLASLPPAGQERPPTQRSWAAGQRLPTCELPRGYPHGARRVGRLYLDLELQGRGLRALAGQQASRAAELRRAPHARAAADGAAAWDRALRCSDQPGPRKQHGTHHIKDRSTKEEWSAAQVH